MAIKIEMLRCFATVARSGNLADAADILGRTPSAVSMMLKQLEAHLGAPLFESGRKSQLTALGEFVLIQAQRELENFERTVVSIESFARANAGLVRVAAVPSVAAAILPTALNRFVRNHPDVQVQIRDMDSIAVLRHLERERVDLGFATVADPINGVSRKALLSDAFGVVCRADHPLVENGAPIEWHALADHRFIANGVCGLVRDATFKRIFTNSRLMVHNTTSVLAAVRAGVGVTVLPRLVIDADTDKEELRFLAVADAAARRRVDTLRRAHSSLSPAADRFQEIVTEVSRDIAAKW